MKGSHVSSQEMQASIGNYIEQHVRAVSAVSQHMAGAIAQAVELIAAVLSRGGKLLVMGNGGSAADAQHLAAEMVGRFLMERRALPAVALTTDSSILTAVGNDYGFDTVFSRQVEALGQPEDLVIGISTSGHSRNVGLALDAARRRGCATMALLGRDGGEIAGKVDLPLVVPFEATPHIQECHLMIIHMVCDLVEKRLFPAPEGT